MEVKKGYKQTEVGVTPEDWIVKNIGEQIDLLTGFPFPSSGYLQSGVKLLRGSNVKRGVTDWSPDITQYWEEIHPHLKPYLLDNGDIVIAMDGSLVGRSFARLSSADLPALLLQRVARVRSKKIDMGYLKEFICSDYFTKHCDSVKTVTAIPHISPSDIKNFKIPLPPTLMEQAAIATVLSDAGALILSMEKLIAKKRAIKQGVMQELLTGKKRLPGFGRKTEKYKQTEVGVIPDDWEVIPLGEISDVIMGQSPLGSTYNKAGEGVALINGPTEFTDVHPIKIQWTTHPTKLCKKNDLLICVRGSSTGRMNISNDDFCIGRGVAAIRAKSLSNTVYLTNQIHLGIEKLLSLSAGSTFPNVDGKSIRSIKIPLPPTLAEQTTIAAVLSDMDAEVATLETKLTKYKLIKQGMMQNLLTGRIRLI